MLLSDGIMASLHAHDGTPISLSHGLTAMTQTCQRGPRKSAKASAGSCEQEQAEPLGATCQVCDATTLPVLGTFDLVTAIYLLNYASSTD